MSNRDTQFVGFAKLLYGDLKSRWMEDWRWDEDWQKYIAQRAYDLACHVATATILTAHGDMNKIPDLTTWPEEDKS